MSIEGNRKQLDEDLLNAAREGHTKELEKCLKKGANINYQNRYGKSALHRAVWNGQTEICKLLIDDGINRSLKDENGNTALHIAAKGGQIEMVKLLIDGIGMDINIQNQDGNTALHISVSNGYLPIVNYLLERHCNRKVLNIKGQKPIDIATEVEIIHLLKGYEACLPGLPKEIKKLDKKSAHVFSNLLGEESYSHYESRVMLAGEQATGKTTIARYLVGKRPTKIRMSTDGIELYNGLSYMDRETNKWLEGQQGFSLEDITVSRSLVKEDRRRKIVKSPETTTSQNVSPVTEEITLLGNKEELQNLSNKSLLSNDTSCTQELNTVSEPSFQPSTDCADSLTENMNPNVSGVVSVQKSQTDDNDEKYEIGEYDSISSEEEQSDRLVVDGKHVDGFSNFKENVTKDYHSRTNSADALTDIEISKAPFDEYELLDDSHDASWKLGFNGDLDMQTVTKPGVIRKLKNIFGVTKEVKDVKVSITEGKFLAKSSKVGRKKLQNKKIAPILIWDFGGQDVFYSTHQTFLTYRAIYIIVLDGSRKLDDPCPYERYLPGKSGFKTSRDYLLFWVNTIVTYCKGSIQGFPKIMIILTHKDQVKANEVEQRRHDTFTEIGKMFQQTPIMQQLVIDDTIFVNAKDKYDPEMAKIKTVIIRESQRQPTWGEPLPKCFIPLELEFASLIRRNILLITLEHLNKINLLQPIRPLSEDELKVFLKFQHSIGKLLYFDQHKLDERIILSPTLLIDAFKSIVTDKRFCEGDRTRTEIWDAMGKKGVVSKQAIEDVWKGKKYVKFYEHKDYLLNVMTHLDILVEPKKYGSNQKRIPADFYYVASMVRAEDDSGYLQSADITKRNISIAFKSLSLMIPPALSFRFISYCLYVWAVKTYGQTNKDMLFHRSGVFTVDSSLDMYILCEDERIVVRLIHAETNALIMRDMACSINECLTSALEKISQLYIETSSDQSHNIDASFVTSICCNSPDNPCILPLQRLANIERIWTCPSHGIEHNTHTITSWFAEKGEEKCEPGCPVTNEDFLNVTPSDLHLRRLSILFSENDTREIAINLGLSNKDLDKILETDQNKLNFEVLRQCRDYFAMTFRHIKEAVQSIGHDSIHILCKLVKGDSNKFEMEPDKWDMVLTEKHIDRLAPLVGNNSLPFLIELGMEFQTWEQITHRQNERDLVRLNKEILEEWRFQFCKMHSLKPTLRQIGNAFINIGKNVKIVEKTVSDLF